MMHEAIDKAVRSILAGDVAPVEQMEAAVAAIMGGQATDVATASLLTALAQRGEAVEEIVGAARAMRAAATRIPVNQTELLDTCGTGGSGLHTFNISTAAALVVASIGVPVAKHGNRSASSTSGSADVLEALGVNLDITPERVADCISEVGIGFCFARLLHSAMKHVAPVRAELGFRTVFNLLGPLTNPAGAEFQLLGSNRIATAEKIAAAASQLGTTRTLVVCGADEFDEVALWGETTVFEATADGVQRWQWTADDFGLPECHVSDLSVANAAESAAMIQAVLKGAAGPQRDMVVANAAAALVAAGRVEVPRDGAELAIQTIDSGTTQVTLERLAAHSNTTS